MLPHKPSTGRSSHLPEGLLRTGQLQPDHLHPSHMPTLNGGAGRSVTVPLEGVAKADRPHLGRNNGCHPGVHQDQGT